MLGPLLEDATTTPDRLEHSPKASVASRHDPFSNRGCRLVPPDLEATGQSSLLSEHRHLALKLVLGVLAMPLEGGLRFGYEPSD